jgi:hypothetical protein
MAIRIRRVPKALPKWISQLDYYVLYRYANSLRAFYGLPVYLCGSILERSNYRDVDIRIEMPDDLFNVRFGLVKLWIEEGATGNYTNLRWKWSEECVDKTQKGWNDTLMNIDFQIYPKSYCEAMFKDKKKFKLDTK